MMLKGEYNTWRKHVIEQTFSGEIISPKNSAYLSDLLECFEQQQYPQTMDDRLSVLFGTIELLEEIQDRIVHLPVLME